MPKNKVSEYSSTASNNTDIAGVNIAEGCAPSGINNAIRELMAQLKDMQTGADGDNFTVGGNLTVSGTATGVTPSPGDSSTKFATTAFIATALEILYPVGSVYINATNNTNPATLLGFGTWVAFGSGRVMAGYDSTNALFNASEKTGGSADAIVVSHTHTGTTNTTSLTGSIATPTRLTGTSIEGSVSGIFSKSGSIKNATAADNTTGSQVDIDASHNHTFTTASSGSSGTNANIQPYITVYMWKRTA